MFKTFGKTTKYYAEEPTLMQTASRNGIAFGAALPA